MMAYLFSRLSTASLFFLLVITVASSSGSAATCGSLVTYNQFPGILTKAPKCFQAGCGGGNLTSMSDSCDSKSACYPLWNLLNQQYQQPWCTKCPHDVACRISGWPILNATATCNISPNVWLFGNGCCANDNEPSNLAGWIEWICNGTWRDQFHFYDGMAERDWWEWELPWNWTVASTNATHPKCAAKSKYLGLFVIENMVFLLFVVIYAAITMWFIANEKKPIVLILRSLLAPYRFLKKGMGKIFSSKESGGGTGEVVGTIMMAVFFAGVQLGSNFATAYIIKTTKGYEHIPAPELALLFCCRPRIGWLACLLVVTPDSWLTDFFKLPPGTLFMRGQTARTKVAISSAVGEVIMQLLGSYFLGRTTNVGVKRGFYLSHHLTRYDRGEEARIMYVGSLFWVIAAFGVVSVWILVVIWHAAMLHVIATTKKGIKDLLDSKVSKKLQPRAVQKWSQSQTGSQPTTSRRRDHAPLKYLPVSQHTRDTIGEASMFIGSAGKTVSESYDSDSLHLGPKGLRKGPGSSTWSVGASSTTAYDALPTRPQSATRRFVSPTPEVSVTDPTGSVTLLGSNSSGYYHQSHRSPAEETLLEAPGSSHRSAREESYIERSPRPYVEEVEAPGYIMSRHPGSPSYYSGRDTGTAYHETAASYGAGGHSTDDAEDHEGSSAGPPKAQIPQTFEDWQPYILGLGVFLGFLSYIAQWLFWAGFVRTSGDRFCPPALSSTGAVWSLGAVLGLGFLYGS